MKRLVWLAAICWIAPFVSHAQATANPIVSSANEIFSRQSMLITAAVEQMPADKYSYAPTPGQRPFGGIAAHVAQSNDGLCATLSGSAAPAGPKVSETSPKDTVVSAVKASFEFCAKALADLPDSKLGDMVPFYRGRQVPRARVLLELTDDLEDHYSQMASYLRLNGMTPPSAAPRK